MNQARWLLALVMMLLPLEAVAQGGIQSSMADRAAAILDRQLNGYAITVVDPLTLKLKGPDNELQLNLDRIAAFCAANAESCDQTVTSYLDRLVTAIKTADAPPTPDVLRAVVRRAEYLDALAANLGDKADRKPVGAPIAGGLSMVCMFDLPTALRVTTLADLRTLGLTDAAALERCRANTQKSLVSLAGQTKAVAPGQIATLTADQGYTASHFLFHDEWQGLADSLDGHLLVAVPAENIILYCRDDGSVSLRALSSLTRQTVSVAERPLSAQVFRWTSSGWDVADE